MHRPALIGVAAACALTLLSAACTGGDTAPGPSATAAAGEDAAGEEFPELDPSGSPPIFEPDDDVLNVAVPEPATLDPMRIQDPGSALIARQLFEGLTRWDPKLERVRPAAAESWRASGDGKAFIFKLRPGMTFHDGSPVRAQDFAFAFDRIAQRDNAADLAYTLERIVGFEQVNGFGSIRHLAGISTPDDLTLAIRLSEPYHDLPAVLTHPGLVPVPARAVADIDRFLSAPVGNGPFRIAEPWHPGEPLFLQSYPGFIETPDLDGIRFLSYPDAAASYVDLVKGDLDVAQVPTGQVQDAARRFGTEHFVPFLKSEYLGLNVRSPALDDIRLRKAINLAIDRAAISRTVYRGTLEAPRGIVPVGVPGFQENLCVDLCRYSPEAARRLVKAIPSKQRFVRIDYTKGAPLDDLARAVREDLQAVGLRVPIKAYEFPAFLRRLNDRAQQGYRLGWLGEYPTADEFLSPLFLSSSTDNHSGFSSPRVDALLAQAHRTHSPGKRLQLYIEAEKAILRKVPVVPIGSFQTHWAVQRDVAGIRFDVMGGFDAVEAFLRES